MIEIIDDVLSLNDNNFLYNFITRESFQWCLGDEDQIMEGYEDICFKHKQFTSGIFGTNVNDFSNPRQSPAFDVVKTFTDVFCSHIKKPIKQYYRVKFNCQYQDFRSSTKYNPVHVDIVDVPHISLLYYINDSDGDTLFFKNKKIIKRVSPKKNRLVISEGPLPHCSSNPIKTELRFILNTVVLI